MHDSPRTAYESRPMLPSIPAVDGEYAPAAVRDRFLVALDGADRQLPVRLAADLVTCGNQLPGMTCQLLGLPAGSTYGSGARRVLERWRDSGAYLRDVAQAAPPSQT